MQKIRGLLRVDVSSTAKKDMSSNRLLAPHASEATPVNKFTEASVGGTFERRQSYQSVQEQKSPLLDKRRNFLSSALKNKSEMQFKNVTR
jgi:hypothetical protein